MFRSEEMSLCQMFIQPEAAYATVSKLGEAAIVQFKDLNEDTSINSGRFTADVRLCDEMERKLRYLQYVLIKENIPIMPFAKINILPILNPREVMDLEFSIEMDEVKIKDPLLHYNELTCRHQELLENIYVLEKAGEILSINKFINESLNEFLTESSPAGTSQDSTALSIEESGFLTGVIETQRLPTFERMIWRVSHGYALLKYLDMDNTITENNTNKSIFVLYFHGNVTQTHILTICRAFRAKIYYYPKENPTRLGLIRNLKSQLEDLEIITKETEQHKNVLLNSIAENLTTKMMVVKKMKAIYHTLNFFNLDISNECFIGECWIPTNRIIDITKLLLECSSPHSVPSFINVINTNLTPPTYFRTNKFTKGFQSLIDTYGHCSYREVNPAFLSIVTFPFLFAIMFGDIGHGLILLLFSIFVIVKEKKFESAKSDNEIWNIFFFGRYIILLMGLFSIYTGFIYNDIFSKSLNIFGTGWKVKNISYEADVIMLDPAKQFSKPYVLGMDPTWQLAHNKILFSNSYKMKLSIIIGVIHMIIGVCQSVFNHALYKRKIYIFIEFIPRILILSTIFGYLCSLLILKWMLFSAQSTEMRFKPSCAPSILVMFINMVLMQKPHSANEKCSDIIFDGQLVLQKILITIALISVPFMLLAKPMIIVSKSLHRRLKVLIRSPTARLRFRRILLLWTQSNSTTDLTPLLSDDRSNNDENHSHSNDHPSFVDEFILQAIHTIEFVLSTVSHTASYLRLWALSLAHSQLSEVLWSRTISGLSHFQGPLAGVYLWGAFAGWAVLTVTVLVLMEGLSAFLHTLRLHWVEYMSKFYIGEGYPFKPFSFEEILPNN